MTTDRSPASRTPDPRVLALAEGADERRKTPGVVDDLSALRFPCLPSLGEHCGRCLRCTNPDSDDDKETT